MAAMSSPSHQHTSASNTYVEGKAQFIAEDNIKREDPTWVQKESSKK
jgi:hypothetical protein